MKTGMTKIEAGDYRLIKNGETWTIERFLQIGNPAAVDPAWVIISHNPTFQAGAQDFLNKLGPTADHFKQDLATLISAQGK